MLSINKYDEYGIPQAGNMGRFGYTGQTWLPEIGMNYYKARIYSPSLGRFLQTDPIGYGDGMNMYNYVGSDPVNKMYPSGLEEVDIVVAGLRRTRLRRGPATIPLPPVTLPTAVPDADDAIVVQGRRLQTLGGFDLNDLADEIVVVGQRIIAAICPANPNDTLGIHSDSFSGTAFLFDRGFSANVEIGIASPGSLSGSQVYLSGSATGFFGAGAFIGSGESPSFGYSTQPITSGYSASDVSQIGAGYRAGAEISYTRGGSGTQISGGPRGAYGAYIGAGQRHSLTLATNPIRC